MEYTFVKAASQQILDQEIRKSSMASAYQSVLVSGTLINVTTGRKLSDAEFSVLRQVIAAHVPPNPTEAAVQGKIMSAMQFGQKLLIQIATDNVMIGLTTTQIQEMISRYGYIQAMLMSGSLYTALAAMESLKPDDIISPARRDKYVGMIKGYLGL